jgi:predicted phage terminase large subunit-like protein
MRLKKRIDDKEMDGIFKFYPLIDENGKILWPGKFPNMEAVEKEHRRVANEVAWQREYLLRIIMGNDQVVDFEWIQYYEKLPEEKCRKTYVGVDPAFAEGEEADCTAIVWAKVYGRGENLRIYICPDPINQRMNFPEAIEKIKTTVDILKLEHYNVKLFVEQAGGQLSFIYQLNSMKCKTTGITVSTDKKFRLATVSNLIKNGTILFAKHGNEDLIEQMIDFGKGHDDLVDAFTLIIHQIIRENTSGLGIS